VMGGSASKPEIVDGPLPASITKEELDVTLYVFPGSMPCKKISFLLDYYDVKYTLVQCGLSKAEIEWSDYKFVPQAIINKVHICDSPVIYSTLYPIVAGRQMTDAEMKLEKEEVAYGLQPSGEVVLFTNRDDMKVTVDKVMGMGPFMGAVGWLVAPILPMTEENMRKNNPDMKTAPEHLANLKSALGTKDFFSGAQPGPVDLALYGTYGGYYKHQVPTYVKMVETAGLTEYYERMQKHVAEKMGDKAP